MSNKSVLKAILLVFFLSILGTNVFAQDDNTTRLKEIWENTEQPDSLRFEAINSYYRKHTFAEPDNALLVTKYHYDLAKTKSANVEMAKALNDRSYAYYVKGKYAASMDALQESIAILEQLDQPKTLATVYSNLGNIHGEQGEYQDAVRYFNLSLKLFRKLKLTSGEARMLGNLGIIYYELDSYKLALDNFQKSINLYESIGAKDKTGGTLTSIGAVYFKQGKFQECIDKEREALAILLENNDQFTASDSYFLLAQSYKNLGQTDKAFMFIDKSLQIDNEIKNNSKIIERRTFKTNLIFESNINEATKKAEEILGLVQPDTENRLKANVYNLLYRCYKKQNKYVQSLAMHEKFVVHSDSLAIEKNQNSIIEDAIQNEYDEKLLQNKIKNEQIQAELKIKQLRRFYILLLIAVILIGSILYYALSKISASKKKRARLLEEIEQLKSSGSTAIPVHSNTFELHKEKIEQSIDRKLNDTDWNVLNILLEDPVITNKVIAEKICMSVDGIGSSLRRMYEYFEIKDSKYKKISLLMEAIKRSNN